jgi:hypothetical protein
MKLEELEGLINQKLHSIKKKEKTTNFFFYLIILFFGFGILYNISEGIFPYNPRFRYLLLLLIGVSLVYFIYKISFFVETKILETKIEVGKSHNKLGLLELTPTLEVVFLNLFRLDDFLYDLGELLINEDDLELFLMKINDYDLYLWEKLFREDYVFQAEAKNFSDRLMKTNSVLQIIEIYKLNTNEQSDLNKIFYWIITNTNFKDTIPEILLFVKGEVSFVKTPKYLSILCLVPPVG